MEWIDIRNKLIVVIIIMLTFVCMMIGYYFINVQKELAVFTPGQNLTEEQKQQSINIALKDSEVKSEIEKNIMGGNCYNITGVEVRGLGPDTSNITYYPTVIIRLGTDPSFARGLLVHVDLYNKTVVKIGNFYYGPIPVNDTT